MEPLFRRLSPLEQRVVATIAVLSGHADRTAVCSIAAEHTATKESQVNDILDGLARSRFLIREGASMTGGRQFAMHSMARRHCLESAIPQREICDLQALAASYYESGASRADITDGAWLHALDHALQAGKYAIAAVVLFDHGLGPQLLRDGRLVRLRAALESLLWNVPKSGGLSALEMRRTADDRGTTHWLLDEVRMLTRLYWRVGRLRDAELLAKVALDLGQSAPADLAMIAGVVLDEGRLADGLAYAKEAVDVAQGVDARSEMEGWGWIGYALDESGPWEGAVAAYGEAVARARKLGDAAAEAVTESRTGMTYWKIGQVDRAREHFQRGVDLSKQVGDPYYMGLSLGDLGHYYMDRPNRDVADLDQAERCYSDALDIHRNAGIRRGEGFWVGQLGRVALARGHRRVARRLLVEAIDIHIEVGDRTALGRHLRYLAQVAALGSRGAAASIAYLRAAHDALCEVSSTIEADSVQEELIELLRDTPNGNVLDATVVPGLVARINDYCAGGAGRLP
jgi:tetratricopeptide (TPR) repeat protein